MYIIHENARSTGDTKDMYGVDVVILIVCHTYILTP